MTCSPSGLSPASGASLAPQHRLGVSPSALSHTIRGLEERLGVRLLTRTTRSVAPTHAGERLLAAIGPRFDEIETEARRTERAARQAGRHDPHHHRRSCGRDDPVARAGPTPAAIIRTFKVEISVDSGFVDIVAERFDAGVRLGETIAQDMVAVRIGPDMRMAAVASPSYFAARKPPRTPHDLAMHNCINLRFPTSGGLYAWEFEKSGRALNVRVEGQLDRQ